MQLRHIRPGTVDWNDATVDQADNDERQLGPDEHGRLSTSEASATVTRDNQVEGGRPPKN
jgi:hypothetical protein